MRIFDYDFFYSTLRSGILLASACFTLIGSSCSSIKNPSKIGLGEGVYRSSIEGSKAQSLYLEENGELLDFYPIENRDREWSGSQSQSPLITINKANPEFSQKLHLMKKSFDLDLITIPIKYRPAAAQVPSQINSVLNAAAYFGYRMDYYQLDGTKTNPIGKINLAIDHFGFSLGGFLGIGNSELSPTTTLGNIPLEYEGIVLSKGIAAIFAVNKFTMGIGLGWDNLLDSNRSFWIYQNKPWLGLAIGINLN